jgi:S-adenosylmethionine-diacylglycerol 3-amino-3-carboxypropyl transferase
LKQALDINSTDDVLSIASGGDNSFELLLANPRALTAIDFNHAQIHLVELKMTAMKHLDYQNFVRFVGARPCEDRLRTFHDLIPRLSVQTADFWLRNLADVQEGIIGCGRFERYLNTFRRFVLPLIHNRHVVNKLLSASTLEQQRQVYREIWNTRPWQWLFRVFFGRFLMSHFGRRAEFFRYIGNINVARTLYRRVQNGLTHVPIGDNFYVEYILTGRYGNLENAPSYLHPFHFHTIKSRLYRINLVCASLRPWLSSRQAGSFSKFNLSDVFEYMSDAETGQILREIIRVSRPGSRLAYWTLFAERSVPTSLNKQLELNGDVTGSGHIFNRSFFYDRFLSCRVKQEAA